MTDLDPLQAELSAEYHALIKIVSDFDGRVMLIKGWSVTLSLASLGLGFTEEHYALFALAAATALGFWSIETMTKRHQMQYYPRMRDIEWALSRIIGRAVDGRDAYAPAIDWYWGYTGTAADYRTARPKSRDARNIQKLLARVPWMGHVLLPHLVAVVLGTLLSLGAAVGVAGLDKLPL